ncbi:serine hydrolase [Sphingomonas sp. CROZ-RG-20F-R02-07]|uniref:serine hydrolase n=1 Tax=Sphingomonas sp. CROZ-RG-20F-R02-07 TaxID=2914832 RepID=UPI001F5870A1|nr:serine hydrolase [Sphingomonas sp. CROZ-RG-20F-R02-07]
MQSKGFGRLGLIGMLALLGACGSSSRPGSSGAAPGRDTPVVVSIPVPPPAPRTGPRAPEQLARQIAQLRQDFGGKVGIAVRAVDAGWTVEAGGHQLLPQQSVSKLWVAITLLSLRDAGKARLDDPIVVRPEDITLFHQPVAMLVKGDGYHTTVGGLLTRALTQSDNTANDRLLTYVGGPPAVRAMIAAKRLGDIHFGPGERLLQSRTAGLTWQPSYAQGNNFEIARARLTPEARAAALDAYVGDPPDGAAPVAIADALARLARGELLSETSTRILLDTMGASLTGRARLRAALPPGWSIAHKTGTGQDLGARNAGFNDVGLLTAPDGRRYALAVMIGDTRRPMHDRQLLIQAVASAVAGYAAGGGGSAN